MRKLLGFILFLLCTSSMAQQHNKNKKEKLNIHYSPVQAAIMHSERLTIALKLNDIQKKRVKNSLIKRFSSSNKDRKALKSRGARVSSTKRNKNNVDNNHKRAMRKILTKSQFIAWEKLQKPKSIHRTKQLSTKEVTKN